MTRADLARIVGVSGQTIYRWEVGLSWLPPLQALKIARELGIEIRYDCPSCEMRIAVSGRGIEPAGDQKIRALLRSAYLMIDDLPIGDVEDARRIFRISALLEDALDLVSTEE